MITSSGNTLHDPALKVRYGSGPLECGVPLLPEVKYSWSVDHGADLLMGPVIEDEEKSLRAERHLEINDRLGRAMAPETSQQHARGRKLNWHANGAYIYK